MDSVRRSPAVLSRTSLWILLLALAAGTPGRTVWGQPGTRPAERHPGYTSRPDHDPDGTGRIYMGREIARVMGHEAADWLDRPEREREEHAKDLLELLRLHPGDTVADIGAGSGYHSLPMARAVGPAGRVKAVDIQQEMLDLIERKARGAGVGNVDLILGAPDDPRLPAESVDVVLMVDVYHEFEFPYEMMQHIVRATRPGGRIVFVEFRLEDPEVPIKRLHKMSEAQVIREMGPHGLKHQQTHSNLPWQHVIVFEKQHRPWLGVHVMAGSDREADALIGELDRLVERGVNTIVVEVNYNFEFTSHPELHGERFLSRAKARQLVEACRTQGIRVVPQLNCLGHQSWAGNTGPLLTKYPHFDETPGRYPQNQGIYCRSWCPQHPEVNAIVFQLMDELIEGFEADAFHVGMDEVFLIGSDHCPRCKGQDPAALFARAINDYHGHLVGRRRVQMLLWGDRLLDSKTTGYGEWEAAKNGTHPAVDRIPKDIIICDWHYGKRTSYPSIPYFIEKGFRVWPAGWDKVEATEALVEDALRHRGPRMLGHLCTVWGKARAGELDGFPPLRAALAKWRNAP